MRRPRSSSAGFTLAELAVTLVICSLALTLVLQGVNTAMSTAAHTHNRKVARDMALQTLGQVESGLFWEDMDDRLYGSYDEEGYPDFYWEVVVGDDALSDLDDDGEPTLAYDSWAEDPYDDDDDDIEGAEEPFERVRIRVTFPKTGDWPSELVIERWIPWDQVYGSSGDDRGGSGDDDGEDS